ncbi:FAD-dependent oxidoreductase [Klebsiella pneumoniae]|nr:FAD-dependent oxidoreductase [Klebsiella pneumoniae]
MSDGIVIIGSGFAARQLVKNIRKQDAQIPLTLIAADSMDEYNKPDLSHVISRGQKADDLTLQSAGEFAEQYTLRLFPHTWVSDIDAENRLVKSQDNQWRYDKLVLATGATPFIPSVPGRELMLTLNSQRAITVDAVVAAAGLRPETSLARHAGLQINRGIVVNSQLQTSDPAIYALGDCAEINGVVLPFLQPILLSAMCLSKNLLAQAGELKLPPMLVKVKTPDLPLHLAGDTRRDDLTWNIVAAKEGLVAKGVDAENQLRAFVVSEDKMKEAFALLKQLVS